MYTPGYYYPNNVYGGNSGSYYSSQPANTPIIQQPVLSQTGIIWVDGEIGAKAYQIPAGNPGPIALWDTNDQVIYLKSVNQMGMPNPLQKIRYQIEEQPQIMLPAGMSMQQPQPNASDGLASKEDVDALRNEIAELKNLLGSRNRQNGSNSMNTPKGGGANG